MGINLDAKQREILSKQELDSIYLTSTEILTDINDVVEGKEISEKRLEYLKEKALEERDLFDKETFDIFGGTAYDNKLNTLANKKHREARKEVFNILPITKYTTLSEYLSMILEVINNLKTAFQKIKIGVSLPVYKCTEQDTLAKNYNVFSILATDAIQTLINQEKIKEINLYKINLNEGTNILAYTNGTYYDNTNKTLPTGMNVEKCVLLDVKNLNLKEINKRAIKVVCNKEQNNELSEIVIKQINITELTMEELDLENNS